MICKDLVITRYERIQIEDGKFRTFEAYGNSWEKYKMPLSRIKVLLKFKKYKK